MTINIVVKRQGNEHNSQVLRKFSQRVRELGIIQFVRNNRFRIRPKSRNMRHKEALKRLQRRAIIQKLIKEGKLTPTFKGKIQIK